MLCRLACFTALQTNNTPRLRAKLSANQISPKQQIDLLQDQGFFQGHGQSLMNL
jgi:hypothetical protein